MSLQRLRAGIFAMLMFTRNRELARRKARVYSWIDERIRGALDRAAKAEADEPTSNRYVLLHELARDVKDVPTLRGEVLNVFTPGRDGVAVLVSNALFQLARHPDIWSDLRSRSLTLSESEVLSFEKLSSLIPFRNVVNEALRTLGPYGVQARSAPRNTILPCGGGKNCEAPVALNAGDSVRIFTWNLHHDANVFGTDPYAFIPDRWNDLGGLGFQFVPFSAGRRICPSQRQSIVQAIYVLVRLTREFARIENRDSVQQFVERHIIIMESRNGVKITLHRH